MILGPILWVWFTATMHEQREWRFPPGPSEVSIAGIDRARILVIGDGPAAGLGVRTHQLGIAGHLARHLVRHLDRGVVVAVAAQPTGSARSTLKRLDEVDIEGYDVIVLMLAVTDALCLTSRRRWRRNMTGLIEALEAAGASYLFVTSAASLQMARPLAPLTRLLAGRHARTLTVETRRICSQTASTLIPLDAASDLTSGTYARWGRSIGTHLAEALAEGHVQSAPEPRRNELPCTVQRSGMAAE